MSAPVRRSGHIASIHAAYPDLRMERTRRNDEGLYNDVLVVNDDLIFRFPRDADGIDNLEVEVALLRRIRPLVTLPIPDPTYASFTPRAVGHAFAGYRMLPGEPLWQESFATIRDVAVVQRLAVRLAAFLRALHAIPPEVVADVLPASDWQAQWIDLDTRVRTLLFPHISHAAQERIAALFATFLNDPANFTFTPAIIHGDFGNGNALFDAHAGDVTGVIDFGSAGTGDPAYDVAGMLAYGESFVQQGFVAYPPMEAMLPRARFYLRTFPLHEALDGVEHNDAETLSRGIDAFLGH